MEVTVSLDEIDVIYLSVNKAVVSRTKTRREHVDLL
jgi:hypothetical protein